MGTKVFIDPGHGGNDSGAVGNGLRECDINLAVSKRVQYHLQRQGIEIMMSRESDTSVSLDQRTNMANKWGADALVSIHCNSATPAAYGVETYCYQFQYRKLADAVHGKILEDTSLYYTNRGVKAADFHMLRESYMSAALVEMAFISNSRDAQLLVNKQEGFAIAISKGILAYFGKGWTDDGSTPQPPTPEPPTPPSNGIDVYYKAYANGIWYPEVKNLTDYAGVYGKDMECIMARLSSGTIEYRVSPIWANYYPWVRNYTDYAGLPGYNIDRVQMRLIGLPNNQVKYRVHLLWGNWLPWVLGESDFAGIQGKAIDAIEIQII